MSLDLELYKFISENSIENHWENNNTECLVWIPYYCLDDFVTRFSSFFETEDNVIGYLQQDYVCIDLVALGMDDEIDLSEVVNKEWI